MKQITAFRTVSITLALVLSSPVFAAGGGGVPSGSLDITASADFNTYDSAQDVVIQSDGRIVSAGSTSGANSPSQFALSRHLADGNLDFTLGGAGKVTTSFGIYHDQANGVALQTINGSAKIVVAGFSSQTSCFYCSNSNNDIAVARYNAADGSLDGSFGIGGKVTLDFGGTNDKGYDVAVQSDGKVVVVGSTNNDSDFLLVRLNQDGTLDSSFGMGGRVVTATLGAAKAVVIPNATTLVVAGGNSQFTLARYKIIDGSLDGGFGTNGIASVNVKDKCALSSTSSASSLAVQSDGKLVAAGSTFVNRGISCAGYFFALARFTSAGVLDSRFGNKGTVTTRIPDNFSNNGEAYDVAIQSDQKIVAVGEHHTGNTQNNRNFVVIRYNASGALDSNFGSGGIVISNFGSDDAAKAVAIQPNDNKVIAAGYRSIGDGLDVTNDFFWARYNP